MGWQDRDWAKLEDAELDALYGVRPSRAGLSTRRVVWGAVAALTIAVGGWGYTHRVPGSSRPSLSFAPAVPDVIYGQPTAFAGQLGVCTEYEVDTSGAWRCDVIRQPTGSQHVARAAAYDGPCAHLSADQTTGRWVCVAAQSAGPAPGEPNGVNG